MKNLTALFFILLVYTAACSQSTNNHKAWKSLFNGKNLEGWHTYGNNFVGKAWQVSNGIISFDPAIKSTDPQQAGDLVTNNSYENFDLELEWKISKNGNSGIIFWVQDDPTKYQYVWQTGAEMQVLDNDGHPDGKILKHRAGNLYDLVESKEGVAKPAGKWNKARIIAYKGKLTFYLNGQIVMKTTYGDEKWNQMVAQSKFSTMPGFAKSFKGHIALQDHNDKVWYRNIKIKELQ